MNRNQIIKSQMYGTVDYVLDNYFPIFDQFDAIVSAHKRLKDGLMMIELNQQEQQNATSDLTISRIQLRGNIVKSISKFSAELMDYATSTKDATLKSKANYSVSKLKIATDPVLYDIGILMLELAKPVRAELTKYFVDETVFTKLEKSLTAFKMAITQKRVAISTFSPGNIDEVFQTQDQLLKDEIDILMLPFQSTHPDFYNAYNNARILAD